MSSPLAVTSLDQAAGCLRRAGIVEEALAWFDPLHIGPVAGGVSLDALADHRAAYFQLQSFGFSRIGREYYAARDKRLLEAIGSTPVLLVFQRTFLDQLHLIQVLDLIAGLGKQADVRIVHVNGFIDELSEQAIADLAAKAVPVTPEMLDLARAAWDAYRQPTPEAWADLASYDTSALPFLARAVKRGLEELPHTRSGLTRSQIQIVELLKRHNLAARDLYRAHFGLEPHSHLEDWVFYAILDGLAEGPFSLIEGKADVAFNPNMALIDWRRYVLPEMKLTSYGAAVLRGEVDDRKHNGTDHWWGGTHLTDGAIWRWDVQSQSLVAPGEAMAAAPAGRPDAPVSDVAGTAA
jgi:hypothetical protein